MTTCGRATTQGNALTFAMSRRLVKTQPQKASEGQQRQQDSGSGNKCGIEVRHPRLVLSSTPTLHYIKKEMQCSNKQTPKKPV